MDDHEVNKMEKSERVVAMNNMDILGPGTKIVKSTKGLWGKRNKGKRRRMVASGWQTDPIVPERGVFGE